MKLNLSKIESNILSCLKNHFIEMILGVCFFVMFVLMDHGMGGSKDQKMLTNVMLLFPLFFALTYTCNRLFSNRLRLLYYLSLFFFVPAFYIDLSRFTFSISYNFTMLLAFFLLLINRGKRDNVVFAKDTIQSVIHLIVSIFIGQVMALAICAIIGSMIYIFNFEWYDWLEYSYIFVLFIVTPMVFCHLQDTERFRNMPPFMDIILTYILSPAIIIYTGILYLYFIMIAVNWELPKGKIGYMVLAFVIFALGGKMFQLLTSRRYYDWFYNHFSIIAIPPVIIFWVGTVERITTYSFTTSRVYLLAAGVLMTLYIILLLSKRFGKYQSMLVISIFCIVALTFIPGISAKRIGIYAQENRLEKYIKKLDMLDPVTHQLKTGAIFSQDGDSETRRDQEELLACYRYLEREQGEEVVQAKYGSNEAISLSDYQWDYIDIKGKVDVTGYSHYQRITYQDFNLSVSDGMVTLTSTPHNKTILKYNIDEVLNDNAALMLNPDSTENTKLFVYKDEQYMLILNEISYKCRGGKYQCTNVSGGAILSK